jgi:hypothetical protein
MIDDHDPAIATVIRLYEAGVRGALIQDEALFAAHMAPELMVNSPANRVLACEGVLAAFRAGFIAYAAHDHTLELAIRRPNGEVLLMGEEVAVPAAASPLAGKRLSRRFTEIWRLEGEDWLLSVRQATVYKMD